MAVAMESTACDHPGHPRSKSSTQAKTAWGADAQKLMQLMMGQLHQAPEPEPAVVESPDLSTLDLFGQRDPTFTQLAATSSPEFLELEPEEPLSSGWEKCLDLKSVKLYYVEKCSGVSTFHDPRKQLSAHEFLGSKSSETWSLKASSSSSSETPRKPLRLLQTTTRGLDVALGDVTQSLEDDHSNVELDLNLAAGGGGSSSPNSRRQTVCTMEMIRNALRRSETTPSVQQRTDFGGPQLKHKLSTVSSSFSSLTSTRSDPVDSGVAPSPSTSSSSSTSSRSAPTGEQSAWKSSSTSTGVCDEDGDVSLVMGACTRCLMYVMLRKRDPKCPRCEGAVSVDFSEPPCKRQRGARLVERR